MGNTKTHHWEKIAVFVFGVVFILILLALVLLFPVLTPEAYTIFRIVIALAAAGIGAVIPGFLDVQMKGLLRASGSMALFVIVYFFSPAPPTPPTPPTSVIDQAIPKNPVESTENAIKAWFSLVDQEQYSKAWTASSKVSKANFEENTFVTLFLTQRKPLGSVVSRVSYGVQALTALATGQKGNFRHYTYRTTFSNGQEFIEGLMLTTEDGTWKVLNHDISVMAK